MSVVPSALDEDIDIILPMPSYSQLDLHNEIRAIHGGMLQLRVRLDRALRADQETRLSGDARIGGVDRRLDKLEGKMSAMEQKLDRLLDAVVPG